MKDDLRTTEWKCQDLDILVSVQYVVIPDIRTQSDIGLDDRDCRIIIFHNQDLLFLPANVGVPEEYDIYVRLSGDKILSDGK